MMVINAVFSWTAVALLISTAAAATEYTNHTVGGNAGWFFHSATNTSVTNYTSWAANQTFNIGDYLIFRTDTNQTVIQTFNETTFQSCSTDDASDNDTFQYDGGSTAFSESQTIAVPLTEEGPNYFFSDANDGIQCQNGLAFGISVNHGLGLPPSLNQPPPPPYIEPPGPDAEPPPVTIAGGSPLLPNGALSLGADARVVLCALIFGAAAFLRS
ncbi:hypothetical protein SLE2022_178750 [Rubroshorea leprosula]